MKKTYYLLDGNVCLDECKHIDFKKSLTGTIKIGSVACSQCQSNIGHDSFIRWVICEKDQS